MSRAKKGMIKASMKMERLLDMKAKSKCVNRIRRKMLSDLGHEINSLNKIEKQQL